MTEKKRKHLELWDRMAVPPADAIKPIKGGRLSGKSDINPQWRTEIMTEVFGPCGIGWKYEVTRQWMEPGANDTVAAFVNILLFVMIDGAWSEPIPGTGGSMFVEKENSGLHTSDECYKMATTDALSVAMKMLGVGASIYRGFNDGSKYAARNGNGAEAPPSADPRQPAKVSAEEVKEAVAGIEACTDEIALKRVYTRIRGSVQKPAAFWQRLDQKQQKEIDAAKDRKKAALKAA